MPFHLIYASSATRLLSGRELEDILRVARRNNARDGITGMLLYKDGNFIQLLEGESAAVLALMDSIRGDDRHRGILVLDEREVDARVLPDWTMGFSEAGADATDADGLFELTRHSLAERLAPDAPRRIVRFMRNFYEINRS